MPSQFTFPFTSGSSMSNHGRSVGPPNFRGVDDFDLPLAPWTFRRGSAPSSPARRHFGAPPFLNCWITPRSADTGMVIDCA